MYVLCFLASLFVPKFRYFGWSNGVFGFLTFMTLLWTLESVELTIGTLTLLRIDSICYESGSLELKFVPLRF
ncbi:hypothetical protein RIF29_17868 [Crotalaria pallida]|uniref:Uncharacterized protein n=1 Tax=Crotalaria pallida TaxID=3830 RepID=A0AAN9FRN4_CROPI